MNVSCPSCNTVFRVDPAKVPEGGVRARCTVCHAVFKVVPEAERQLATPAAVIVQAPAQPAPAPQPMPAAPQRIPSPAAPRATPPAAPAAPRAPAPAPPRPGPGAPRPLAPSVPPAARPPVVPRGAPASAPAPASGATSVPAGRPQAPRPAAPINPFLSQDPNQKARRLARALVSDLVVYHPDKRQEGLKNDSLKELFDDEIKKSWEEYTEQVGSELASSTSYFNDALNEILGDGRKIF